MKDVNFSEILEDSPTFSIFYFFHVFRSFPSVFFKKKDMNLTFFTRVGARYWAPWLKSLRR